VIGAAKATATQPSKKGDQKRQQTTAGKTTNGHSYGRKWHDTYPELGTAPVPIDPYISPEFFKLERERVFRRTWLNLGRVGQIPNPGDFAVKDIAIYLASAIIVRDRRPRTRCPPQRLLASFDKVGWEQKGCGGAFTCRFHALSYGSTVPSVRARRRRLL
jgi:phenylpropionate dioxygenase-like ring-hydroxylating dioxygenase large terminal subunit